MPLIAHSGQAIGCFPLTGSSITTLPNENYVFSCFWRVTAADLIEYWQSHALRQSAERMRRAISVEAVGTVFFNVQGLVNAANDTFLRNEPLQPGGVGAGGNARLK